MNLNNLYDLLAKVKQIIGDDIPIMLEQADDNGNFSELPLETWEVHPDRLVLKG